MLNGTLQLTSYSSSRSTINSGTSMLTLIMEVAVKPQASSTVTWTSVALFHVLTNRLLP